jgi:hypothetical protein
MRIVTPAAGFLDTREVHKFAGRVRATGDAGVAHRQVLDYRILCLRETVNAARPVQAVSAGFDSCRG